MGLHVAVRVGFDRGAGFVHGVIEEVVPDFLMDEAPVCIFAGRASGDDGGVGALGVFFDIKISDEAARVSERSRSRIDVYERSELLKAKELPRTAVVISGPSPIEDVGEAEESVQGCC